MWSGLCSRELALPCSHQNGTEPNYRDGTEITLSSRVSDAIVEPYIMIECSTHIQLLAFPQAVHVLLVMRSEASSNGIAGAICIIFIEMYSGDYLGLISLLLELKTAIRHDWNIAGDGIFVQRDDELYRVQGSKRSSS